MTQQPDPADAPLPVPPLKVVEPKVDAENPWGDDVLERKEIADRLTTIVRGQEAAFVFSLDGRWGTGKTFLLERWAHDLRNQGFEAIYFNAWEDDFNDDPLLAIIGQLSEYFDEGALREIARGVAGALGHILVKRVTGASPDELTPDSLLNDYQEGLRTKSAVKDRLEQLGEKVRDDTGQPLVFIIDELDRCRPTFAIELLERVKHIFDVPNIVFVFGINRGELVKSLESVYGEIDAGTYLRRFFDMEFILPDTDPEPFCASLVRRFRLDEFFMDLSKTARSDYHVNELQMVSRYLPVIVATMGLSLRDIDYCVRLLALASRALSARQALHPALFVVLVAVKIENPDLYRRFIAGSARGAEIVDYLNGRAAAPYAGSAYTENDVRRILTNVEGALYCADDPGVVLDQLEHLAQGTDLGRREYLSSEIARLDAAAEEDRKRIEHMTDVVQAYRNDTEFYGIGRSYLAARIDLYAGFVRS